MILFIFMNVLSVKNITKTFGKLTAVDNLSFEVPQGIIYGFLGPNGAGKTTTIRMIMEIIIPDSGEIHLFDGLKYKQAINKVGYLPEERGLYRKMKIEETVLFFAGLKEMDMSEAKSETEKWLKEFGLYERKNEDVEALSKGNQQKLQFICTIIHKPNLLILDEPFAGLDPVNVDLVKNIILKFKQEGKSIIFSTHMMEQVEKICDNICLINNGLKVIDGELQNVKQKYGKNTISIEYKGDISAIKNNENVLNFNDFGKYIDIVLKENITPSFFLKQLVNTEKLEINKFHVLEPSLHQIFVDIVKGN